MVDGNAELLSTILASVRRFRVCFYDVKFSNSRLQLGQCHLNLTSRRRHRSGNLLAGVEERSRENRES